MTLQCAKSAGWRPALLDASRSVRQSCILKGMREGSFSNIFDHENEKSVRLFIALAENLKMPLVQIARGAEISRAGKNTLSNLEAIESVANNALQLADSYLMSLNATNGQLKLSLEPVSISSVLYSVANELGSLAKAHHCNLELDYGYNLVPVMANRKGLTAAITSLTQSFIEFAAQTNKKTSRVVTLAAHNSKRGIVAGVFADVEGLNKEVFQRGRALYGKVKLPLSQISGESGTGIFIADSLFEQMESRLRTARHNNQAGLAATLLPSRQLSLV